MSRDMTIAEAISDPMIVQVLRADKVPMAAFVQLLQSAARLQKAQKDRVQLATVPVLDAATIDAMTGLRACECTRLS